MNDHTHLIERVAARNPVPNLDDPPIGAWEVDVVRSAVTERDNTMLTEEKTTEATTPHITRRFAGWKVAFASFAIILLAAGGLWFAARGVDEGDVASELPTTNAPANERERIALDTMVAYFTGSESELLSLTSATDPVALATMTRDFRLDQALNARAESITCTTSGPTNASVTCELVVNDDLLAALGIKGHAREAKVLVLDGGWKEAPIDLKVETEPIFESFWNETNSGLFDEGGLCFWAPNIDVSTVDWDACVAAWVPFAEGFAAEYGQ